MKLILKIIFTILVLAAAGAAVFVLSQTRNNLSFTNDPDTNSPLPTTTLFLAGDVMLSRNVHLAIAKDDFDFTLPFQKVADVIKSADIAFANLESPFLDRGPYGQQGLVFKAQPAAIDGIKYAGFDVLSTANNHGFDQGLAGIQYTLSWLEQNGIKPIGTSTACHDGLVMEKNGIKIGFLAYSYAAFNDGGRKPDPWVCDWNDVEQIQLDVARLKAKADYVVVSGQFGVEYQRTPEKENVGTAHAVVDAGADIVIGHHPHWIQTIEQYNGKWIFYSLGNFVFDQMWSQDTREGLTLAVTFDKNQVKKIELKPVIIDDFCCPRWADETETKNILSKINLTSTILVPHN